MAKEEIRPPAPREVLAPAVEFERSIYLFHIAPLRAMGVPVPEEPPVPGPATIISQALEGKSPLALPFPGAEEEGEEGKGVKKETVKREAEVIVERVVRA